MTDTPERPHCRECYRTEPSAFCSAEPNCMFRKKVEAGTQPDTTDLEENIDSNDRLAEGLVRGVQEMGASQAKLPVHIDGETWDVTVRFRGAQPDSQFEDWVIEAARQILTEIALEKPRLRTSRIAEIIQAARGSSPAPSPQIGALWLCYHALKASEYEYIDGVEHGCSYCGDHRILGHDEHCMIGNALKAIAGVTGNEGKDENGNGDNLHPANSPDDTTGAHHRQTESSEAPPAVVTPEQYVKNLRESCHDTYNGGHHDDKMREAFHHGMDTVCNVLAGGSLSRFAASKVSELEAQLQRTQMELDRQCNGWIGAISRYVLAEAELERMSAGGKS